MNWITKLIPDCCSSRQAQSSKNPQRSLSAIPPAEIIISNESNSDIINRSPEISHSLNELNPEENKEKLTIPINKVPQINESRRSTNHTAYSNEIPEVSTNLAQIETISCGICSKEVEGYCPSCPNIRYCKKCYQNQHSSSGSFHKFIQYCNRISGDIKAENYIKINKLK